MEVKHINPDTIVKPRGYSHAISVTGSHKTIYVGGQNAIDETGSLIGKNSLKQQTEQVLTNINKVLESAGAKLENVIKFNIYISQGEDPQDGFQAFQEKWADRENFPAITVLFVSGFVNPDWLIEIDAIAIMQE